MESIPSDWIKLNVGGVMFLTQKSTLRKAKEGHLSLLGEEEASASHPIDSSGAYLIDRDPKYFNLILNYLRDGKIYLNEETCIESLLCEAKHYGISSLIKILEISMNTGSSRKRMEKVYRLLQMNIQDLAVNLGEMTDGWSLEQVIKTGVSGSNDEFLCIISKDNASSIKVSQLPRKVSKKIQNRCLK